MNEPLPRPATPKAEQKRHPICTIIDAHPDLHPDHNGPPEPAHAVQLVHRYNLMCGYDSLRVSPPKAYAVNMVNIWKRSREGPYRHV
ncbi:hypothetical protein ACFL0V_00970 [Nanoarchaeota archaeon]